MRWACTVAEEGARWALVTAGAAGLGAGLVRALVQDGFRVVVHYHRSREAFDALERELGAAVSGVSADLSTSEGRATVVDAVEAPALSVLVNNLGVYPEEDILDIDDDRFDEIFRLTCTASFDLVRRLRPRLAAAAPSHVVNIGDSGADRIEARRQATPYHIAKLGVHVLTRTWAEALAPEGISVNMVSPGFLVNSVGEPGEPIPVGRPGAFDDVAAALRFLISDAATYVRGTNVLVNGGWNLG